MYRHHARKWYHMRAWCRHTRGRFECAHGVRFERKHGERMGEGEGGVRGGQRETPTPTPTHCPTTTHTTHKGETHNTQHRTRKVASSVLFTKICFRRATHLTPEVHQRHPWILYISSLRIDREQQVPDSSNQSLYLIKLFSFSNLEGSSGGNQQPDGSISLSPSPPPPSNTQRKTHNTQRHRHSHRDRDKTQV